METPVKAVRVGVLLVKNIRILKVLLNRPRDRVRNRFCSDADAWRMETSLDDCDDDDDLRAKKMGWGREGKRKRFTTNVC